MASYRLTKRCAGQRSDNYFKRLDRAVTAFQMAVTTEIAGLHNNIGAFGALQRLAAEQAALGVFPMVIVMDNVHICLTLDN